MPRKGAILHVGELYGRLTLREPTKIRRDNGWVCDCACGSECRVSTSNLAHGHIRSCGCLLRETTIKRSTTHGCAGRGGVSPEYVSWAMAKTRCFNPHFPAYRLYGGRGITMCERWASSFQNFLSDMGPCPSGLTLERKDNDGNYEPVNCRWATRYEQSQNRQNSRLVEYRGVKQTISQWARSLGIKHRASLHKDVIRKGRSIQEVIIRRGIHFL
jgi:hypothetical protein